MYLESVNLEKGVPKFIVQVIIENKPYINDPEGETIHKDLVVEVIFQHTIGQVCKDVKNGRHFKNRT